MQPLSRTELLLDTYCTITIGGTTDETLLAGAFDICRQLDALLNITDDNSDIHRVNNAEGEHVAVSLHTLNVIRHGLNFSELSDGMFDITIGRLSRLWDFGSGKELIPDEQEIRDALQTVDYRQVQIIDNAGEGTIVQLENKDAWIDLGGIAKGYIADEIARFLSSSDITGALIDLGGDIYALGCKDDGSAWRIGVRRPFGSSDDFIGVLELSDAAVFSSGIYERQFEAGGVLYHHILDPITGMPAVSDITGATVIAETGVTAEGLATLAVLLGSADIQAVFEQAEGFIGAVLVLDNNEVLTYGNISLEG